MEEEEAVEMESEGDSSEGAIPFQLQFEKPMPSQVKIAVWNPEKDILAMVTVDNKVLLHRFNWQRLWSLSPGKGITSLCWRPDGKAVALGLEDGTILLHDVENGKLLRVVKTHSVAVTCLNWEEEDAQTKHENNLYTYEDRTGRFFPPSPRIPRMPGLGSGDSGLSEESDDSFQELSNCSYQQFNVLCSGDKDGCLCFSVFGIFLMGKVNIRNVPISTTAFDGNPTSRLHNASIQKVALSKSLSQLIVLCTGEVNDDEVDRDNGSSGVHGLSSSYFSSSTGLHCVILSTCIFFNRKNELHQVALQASNIDHLMEVIRESISVMSKQWASAMASFNDKFNLLSSLIVSHGGLDWNPQDEFLSLLFGTRTSPALHQFLVNSLGDAGLKRVSKAVNGAGKELHGIIHEHLQPAIDTIGFRVGELRGLSRWHARFQIIGLDEMLIEKATEKTGMLLVQVERFARVLAVVNHLFQNFFTWVSKCIKILLSEPTDQIQQPNCELVVLFLKFFFDQDHVGQLLKFSQGNNSILVNPDTTKHVEELMEFGGFSDTKFLGRTLSEEFDQLEQCFKEAFLMPFTTVSKKIYCEDFIPLYPSDTSLDSSLHMPTSISYYKGDFENVPNLDSIPPCLLYYICFKIPDESFGLMNCIGILKGFSCKSNSIGNESTSLAAVLLCIPDGYCCVDLSLYKENQLFLLLTESISSSESPGKSLMMMLQLSTLPFVSISGASLGNFWHLLELKDATVELSLSTGKARCIPHMVTVPLAVSASRGVASVFSARKHALIYILDENEEVSDAE